LALPGRRLARGPRLGRERRFRRRPGIPAERLDQLAGLSGRRDAELVAQPVLVPLVRRQRAGAVAGGG
jgi:hypothetical protein